MVIFVVVMAADDIGDISWNVPTATLSFPSNIPGLPGHNWANAISMATPIAHKGATRGAMAQAMTLLDFMVRPELVEAAWDYFRDEQTADLQYTPFIRPTDEPATEMNARIMDEFREEMRAYYYDSDQTIMLQAWRQSYYVVSMKEPDGRVSHLYRTDSLENAQTYVDAIHSIGAHYRSQ